MKPALLMSLVLLVLFQTSVNASDHDREYWWEIAKKITLGMKRSAVEQLLPRDPTGLWMESAAGGPNIAVQYHLDTHWEVHISYDRHLKNKLDWPHWTVSSLPIISSRYD